MRALAFLFALLLTSLSCRAEDANDVRPIPVTRTWGDLLATKPIILDASQWANATPAKEEVDSRMPAQLWIGIDRDRTSSNGAALLYCLAQGVSFSPVRDHSLGPFEVIVKGPAVAMRQDARTWIAPAEQKAAYRLYAQSVPVQEAGEYVVELKWPARDKTPEKVCARIKVTVTETPALMPWSPWGMSKQADTAVQQVQEVTRGAVQPDFVMTVCNPEGGLALPKANDDGLPLSTLPGADLPLPALLPEKPDPGTSLKMEGDALVISVPEWFPAYDPNDYFLTRWWVNGKLWNPDPLKAEGIFHLSDGGILALKEGPAITRFILDFQPDRLGAKKGDKIGVQLLFCPKKWECAGIGQAVKQVALAKDVIPFRPPEDFSRESNRVDFIYSGDPKQPKSISEK